MLADSIICRRSVNKSLLCKKELELVSGSSVKVAQGAVEVGQGSGELTLHTAV